MAATDFPAEGRKVQGDVRELNRSVGCGVGEPATIDDMSEQENSKAATPVYTLNFWERRQKQIKRWWGKFFVKEVYIPEDLRRICERYGEQVISSLFLLDAAPRSEELKLVIASPIEREYARAWLTETSSYNARRDHWISLRDFVLEAFIIGLILWEIHMGYRQEGQQAQNFGKQQTVLTNLGTSSQATADTLTALKNTTEIMNRNVERNAAAAESTSVTASKSLQFSERAYVACSEIFTEPKAGEKLRVTSEIINSGKTTAVDVVAVSSYGLFPKGISEDDANRLPLTTPIQGAGSNSILAPGQRMDQIVDSPAPLLPTDVSSIADGEIVWYVFTKIRYKDIFDRRHSTDTCVFYRPELKKMVMCRSRKLNKAD